MNSQVNYNKCAARTAIETAWADQTWACNAHKSYRLHTFLSCFLRLSGRTSRAHARTLHGTTWDESIAFLLNAVCVHSIFTGALPTWPYYASPWISLQRQCFSCLGVWCGRWERKVANGTNVIDAISKPQSHSYRLPPDLLICLQNCLLCWSAAGVIPFFHKYHSLIEI